MRLLLYMTLFRKIQHNAHLVVGLLAIVWFWGGCWLIEEPLKNLDDNYAGYKTKVVQYERKIEGLNRVVVYKTLTGERYHRAYHYSSRNHSIPLGNAIKNGYTPCRVCKPPNPGTEIFHPPAYKKPWWIALCKFVLWFLGLTFFYGLYIFANHGNKHLKN